MGEGEDLKGPVPPPGFGRGWQHSQGVPSQPLLLCPPQKWLSSTFNSQGIVASCLPVGTLRKLFLNLKCPRTPSNWKATPTKVMFMEGLSSAPPRGQRCLCKGHPWAICQVCSLRFGQGLWEAHSAGGGVSLAEAHLCVQGRKPYFSSTPRRLVSLAEDLDRIG